MNPDTDIGGPGHSFPATRCSVLLAAASPDPQIRKQAFETLVVGYWKPVYKYLRLKWSATNEDAKDLTQSFFAKALEKGFFDKYDPTKAAFHTFLRVCLDGFVANERASAGRIKRGGDQRILSLDFNSAEDEIHRNEPAETGNLDAYFHQEWVRNLLGIAVEELRRQCEAGSKQIPFKLFERLDLEGPDRSEKITYADLVQEFGLSTSQVTNHLAFARRLFRSIVLDTMRQSCGSDDEFREEARQLLGDQPS